MRFRKIIILGVSMTLPCFLWAVVRQPSSNPIESWAQTLKMLPKTEDEMRQVLRELKGRLVKPLANYGGLSFATLVILVTERRKHQNELYELRNEQRAKKKVWLYAFQYDIKKRKINRTYNKRYKKLGVDNIEELEKQEAFLIVRDWIIFAECLVNSWRELKTHTKSRALLRYNYCFSEINKLIEKVESKVQADKKGIFIMEKIVWG